MSNLVLLMDDDELLSSKGQELFGADAHFSIWDGQEESLFRMLESNPIDSLAVGVRDVRFLIRPIRLKYFLAKHSRGIKSIKLFDSEGFVQKQSRLNFVTRDLPVFSIELILGFFAVSFYALALLLVSRSSPKTISDFSQVKSVAYIRVHFFQTNFGGTLAHTLGVLKGFQTNGFRVNFIVSDDLVFGDHPHHIPPSMIFNNFGEVREIAYNFKLALFASRVLKISRPSFIYFRNTSHSIAPLLMSKLFKIPLVLEFNSSDYWRAKNWNDRRYYFPRLLRLAEKANLQGADVVVTISDQCREQIEVISNRKDVLVLPNGVDESKFDIDSPRACLEGVPDNRLVVGFFGTFMQYHGVNVLGRAIVELQSRGELDKFHFVFVGSGPDKQGLQSILNENRCEGSTSFLGVVPFEVVEQYLNACDILVAPHDPPFDPKDFIGSPIKLFEYMAMGKAVIASDVGQVSEIIQDGETGLLVKPGDHENLADAILNLQDESERRRLGQNAREEVLKKHTWTNKVSQIVHALEARSR